MTASVQATFRDPWGSVWVGEDRVYRALTTEGLAQTAQFRTTEAFRLFCAQGYLIAMEEVSREAVPPSATKAFARIFEDVAPTGYFRHEKVWFPSYPYEWPPEMLRAAGELTLEMMETLVLEDFGLKDASPYNVLFRGTNPVFVDMTSFEPRDSQDMIWLAQAQFIRTFILPLIASSAFGLPIRDVLGFRRDGLEPSELYAMASPVRRLMPDMLFSATLPTWLQKGVAENDAPAKRVTRDPEKARFVLGHSIRRLKSRLAGTRLKRERVSNWSRYYAQDLTYSGPEFDAKCAFIDEMLVKTKPGRVLDVGCNEGAFSIQAAQQGSSVVAIDIDPVVVGKIWNRARHHELDILPLVQNLASPTPGTGWRNRETLPFIERAENSFDMVFMLAVVHHLMVTDGIPLAEIIELAARFTKRHLIIEYISPNDPMFRRLCRGRDDLYADFDQHKFDTCLRVHFDIVRQLEIKGEDRILYALEVKA